MELTKTVAEHLGKVFLNVGQGVALASIVSGLFGKEVHLLTVMVGIGLGAYTAYVGLWFTWKSSTLRS